MSAGGSIDAIVLAGGRISGDFARAAGTTVKALAPAGESTLLGRMIDALRGTEQIARICVVGPEEVAAHSGPETLWQPEADTALGNFLAGVERLGRQETDRVLLCGSDLPAIHAEPLRDFLERAPHDADVALPVVARETFARAYPELRRVFMHLAEGPFTGGSQFLVRTRPLLENLALLERLFEQRKSQVGMARSLGLRFVFRLITRRLTVKELETRLTELTGCRCRAVRDCRPELAYDVDELHELEYARRRLSG